MHFKEIKENNFEVLIKKSEKPLVLLFYSICSGSCHLIKRILKEVSIMYEEKIIIYLVDKDEQMEIAKNMGITLIPAIIFIKNSEIVDALFGTVPKYVIEKKLNKLIDEAV